MIYPNHLKRNISNIGLLLLAFLLSGNAVFAAPETINNEIALVNCQASFEQQTVDIYATIGSITLYNTSEGDYEQLSWDFGDGNYSSSTGNNVDHTYANSGVYTVSLTIWNDAGTCLSTHSKSISVSISNDICDLSTCVWPGDANNDGKADSYDMIHLGFGYGATGPARGGDWEEWSGQPATDWDLETPDGVNYKHLDTNGDGEINEYDMIPMIGHYSPMEETFNYTESDGPRVRLDFDVDTFVINQSTGDYAYVSAGLVIGDADNPIENLHGLSLFVEFDTTLTELSSGINFSYNPNSFFGDSDDVLAYGKNIQSTNQVDMGMTKTDDGSTGGSTGFGRVATFDFIIVVDIIDGRAEQEVNFPTPLHGIKAVDADGNIINLSIDLEPATVVFVKDLAISTKENILNSKVNIYPNPVSNDIVTVELQDLNASSVQFYNTLGQLVKTSKINEAKTSISVSDLPTGLYQLEIQTTEGIANKRLIVK